ncbi:MAG: hypothetical protein JRI66_12130 [Deltaproteobacteria bacterium]|nr:hypothetical protein [Deltaproteobacteria bacterium]
MIYYVGKANDLGDRFNNQYGKIFPRNCYEGGQTTNCRINNLILEESEKNSKIELYFFECKPEHMDYYEEYFIQTLSPRWNIRE